MRRVMVTCLCMIAIVVGSAGAAGAARRQVAHFTGAAADVQFSTCGSVADGELCAFTLVYASNDRVTLDPSEDAGPCLFVEHIVGRRDGPRGLYTVSDQIGRACDTVRITVPRSLNFATVTGTVPTQTCIWGTPDPCKDSGSVTMDLRWQPNGRLKSSAPTTIRYPDYEMGLPCVYHQGRLTTRRAIASGAIPEFGPLGRVVPGTASLHAGNLTFIGQNVFACID